MISFNPIDLNKIPKNVSNTKEFSQPSKFSKLPKVANNSNASSWYSTAKNVAKNIKEPINTIKAAKAGNALARSAVLKGSLIPSLAYSAMEAGSYPLAQQLNEQKVFEDDLFKYNRLKSLNIGANADGDYWDLTTLNPISEEEALRRLEEGNKQFANKALGRTSTDILEVPSSEAISLVSKPSINPLMDPARMTDSELRSRIAARGLENLNALIPTESTNTVTSTSSTPKDIANFDQLILNTVRGKYGNGAARRTALGDNYQAVQDHINKNRNSYNFKPASSKEASSDYVWYNPLTWEW